MCSHWLHSVSLRGTYSQTCKIVHKWVNSNTWSMKSSVLSSSVLTIRIYFPLQLPMYWDTYVRGKTSLITKETLTWYMKLDFFSSNTIGIDSVPSSSKWVPDITFSFGFCQGFKYSHSFHHKEGNLLASCKRHRTFSYTLESRMDWNSIQEIPEHAQDSMWKETKKEIIT